MILIGVKYLRLPISITKDIYVFQEMNVYRCKLH